MQSSLGGHIDCVMFLLCAGLLAALEMRVATFPKSGGNEGGRIFIRRSETDQEDIGCIRSLSGEGEYGPLWGECGMVRNYETITSRKSCNRRRARSSVTRLVKWTASGRNPPSDLFSDSFLARRRGRVPLS